MILNFSMFLRRAALAAAAVLMLALPAAASAPVQLTQGQADTIQRISDYINSIRDIQGEFTQISPKGNLSRGLFFISRPGKMRFEYAPPNPFLIVSDGTWLTIKNTAKEKGDQFPLSQTPLRLVLADHVDLLRETNILGFDETDGVAAVTLEDRGGAMGGQLTLVFDEKQNQLQQWVVTDSKGRRTSVSLENLQAGIKVDPKLFIVKINRQEPRSK